MKNQDSEETFQQKAQAARLALHGRILRCPVGDNPEDCPLYSIRQWPIEERITWLKSKTDEEVVALYEQHMACLKKKTS
jgi:hypothetical protein